MQNDSPVFHQGELTIQNKLGVAKRMDAFARKVVRDHMPAQHMAFYQNLPMLFLGFVDEQDNVWASILPASSGFMQTPNDKTLSINQTPLTGDPLESHLETLKHNNRGFNRVGILGLELSSRRRNRMSGEINKITEQGFEIDVVQTFGNCPQYIQIREIDHDLPMLEQSVTPISGFDSRIKSFIENSDTFFVASSTQPKASDSRDATDGADVSHRGGKPGFIRVDDEFTLTIPDYTGNNHFNTLGNILVNPKVGLLFVDFELGDVYTFTGTASIVWDDPVQANFKGAERLWRFKLSHGFHLKNAMPWRLKLKEWSQNTLMTDTWSQVQQRQMQKANLDRWHNWHVSKIVKESDSISSIYLETPEGTIPSFKAGQHLTLKLEINGKEHIRNYTVSSAPNDDFIRISVKRDGLASNWLHNNLEVGQDILVKLPRGQFHLTELSKPIVLLSAGVGITPMLSMLRYIINEGFRTRRPHPVYLLSSFRNETDLAFKAEVDSLLQQHRHLANIKWLLTKPQQPEQMRLEFDATGRLSKELLQKTLPLDDYDFYLCGPNGFMQDSYDLLISLGVQDRVIFAETFGPSSLNRVNTLDTSVATIKPEPAPAESALVKFEQSQVEQIWHSDEGSLLDFAEAHGFTPDFSCRAGSCGSCKTKLLSGEVTHQNQVQIDLEDNEVLLCCAKPVKTSEQDSIVVLDL